MKNGNLNTLDFIQVMTVEKIKEEIDALKLWYNVYVAGNTTQHLLNLEFIAEHNFVDMCGIYNAGKTHFKAFNWDNCTSMSIDELAVLKSKLDVPTDAKIYLQFERDWEACGDGDVIEFRWSRPYQDFLDFYTCHKEDFDQWIRLVKNDHETTLKFQAKLDKLK